MKLIVAVDENWAIGLKGKLLVSIPNDMKFFVAKTTGNIVVMGRKTLESFPNGLPLPNRVNIVMTSNADYDAHGATVVGDVVKLKEELTRLASQDETKDMEVFVIGGASIYKELLPLCDTAYITKIDFKYDADTYFPNLDEDREWEITEESEEQTYFSLTYRFLTYNRKN